VRVPVRVQPFRGIQRKRVLPVGNAVAAQIEVRESWLTKRHELILPLLKKHGLGTWIIVNEEFHNDPLTEYVAPPRPYVGNRDIFVFLDGGEEGLKRLAVLGYNEENVERFFEIAKQGIKTLKELTKFLFVFSIYNDGIETVIVMASIFGVDVLVILWTVNEKKGNVLVTVNRKYLDDGFFRTVEVAKTDSLGETIIHLQAITTIYTFIFSYEGETWKIALTKQSLSIYSPIT
jgi:hypothetical protein